MLSHRIASGLARQCSEEARSDRKRPTIFAKRILVGGRRFPKPYRNFLDVVDDGHVNRVF
ncbi:MAG: hypothetical protein DME82_13330 [Verrucomicrobia bacterium]|nr:MAG: hypothetical protein DME82_13330 [Verrucomicrobiota bacterium]